MNVYFLISSAIALNEMAIKDPATIRYLMKHPEMKKKIMARLAKKGQHLAMKAKV